MRRCIQLAKMGAGNVAPNPMVGAVLVYKDRIIGEGYHQQYGEAHAEVNCINNVAVLDVGFISKSILYVSLEPCSHFGKTPPCVDLIIKHNISHLIIGCRDHFKKVNGTGIAKLIAAGVNVETGVLENECIALNKRFFTFHQKKRPYIILKWAQSNDGFIAGENGAPIKISNNYTNKLSHKWRAHEAGILVGTNTVIKDNPTLTTRNWFGKNPVRLIIDLDLKIATSAGIFNKDAHTIIINSKKSEQVGNVIFYKIDKEKNVLENVLKCIYISNIISCIIEGGTKTIQAFINAGLWDEARIITNTTLSTDTGIKAPLLANAMLGNTIQIFSDSINFFTKQHNELL
jgi:diaminohydroxyphosphoribosylaminopyrimidine deaminase / 5-amino-6-(5-phosphoribosylamino)uracil reductase